MGFFYIGRDTSKRKYGYIKIGETNRKLAQREKEIKRQESFKVLGYVLLFNETRAQRLYIESYVRMKLEQERELTHVKNDHFLYDIKKGCKEKQTTHFLHLALDYAIEACQIVGVDGIIRVENSRELYSFCNKPW